MFSKADVITASRKFVCVRIDSYDSEENQKIVRSHLNGAFANTAFCILAPDGEERLTRSGRGPGQAVGDRNFAETLDRIAAKYKSKGKPLEAALPDFPSFKLALNVSAADQRALVLVTGSEDELTRAEKRLRSVAWHPSVAGRLHFDLDATGDWKEPLAQEKEAGAGIYIVKPGAYGLKGDVIKRLSHKASTDEILTAIAKANARFAESTEKKVYSEHVATGRRKGITIEMAMPHGEDRDGDGEIDQRRGRNRRP